MAMKFLCGIMALSGLQLIAGSAFADLSITGNWMERVTSANLIRGAGSNLIHEFVSAPGGTTLTISNLPPGSTWRLFARKADSTWKDKLLIHVRRTSGESAKIRGGDAYVQITNADTEIFSGTGNQAGIALQTKLSGMSIKIPPDTYSTSIIFTLQ
jgi:hypothetical protein